MNKGLFCVCKFFVKYCLRWGDVKCPMNLDFYNCYFLFLGTFTVVVKYILYGDVFNLLLFVESISTSRKGFFSINAEFGGKV